MLSTFLTTRPSCLKTQTLPTYNMLLKENLIRRPVKYLSKGAYHQIRWAKFDPWDPDDEGDNWFPHACCDTPPNKQMDRQTDKWKLNKVMCSRSN